MGQKRLQNQLFMIIKEFAEKLPSFPDGRVDYSRSNEAPVMTCFILFEGNVLLLKRSKTVGTYQEKWSAVSGYFDELKPIDEKISEEIREEVGIYRGQIKYIKVKNCFEIHDLEQGRTWLVFPVLVELHHFPAIKLNWEHSEFVWIRPDEIDCYDIIPDLKENMRRALGGTVYQNLE